MCAMLVSVQSQAATKGDNKIFGVDLEQTAQCNKQTLERGITNTDRDVECKFNPGYILCLDERIPMGNPKKLDMTQATKISRDCLDLSKAKGPALVELKAKQAADAEYERENGPRLNAYGRPESVGDRVHREAVEKAARNGTNKGPELRSNVNGKITF